ncbi:MAG: N-acetylmuramoyl-L-alanine amidase [Balneolaceae bacterium]
MRKNLVEYLKVCLGSLLILLCAQILFPAPLHAQHELNRISATERGDGNGFVVRHHLSQEVDSFKVFQPSENLIQMVLYSPELDTASFRQPPIGDLFEDIDVFTVTSGVAIDFTLGEDFYFNTSVYEDQNGRDVLLSLTNTSADNISTLTDFIEPIQWEQHLRSNQTADPFADDQSEPRSGSTMDVVIIDAGHGDKDPGSIGVGGVLEKDIVLAVAKKVGEYIEQNIPDLKVVYTRDNDTFIELPERGRIANRNDGDLFVSIHANSYEHQNIARQQSVSGAEVYILGVANSQSAIDVMKKENAAMRFENGSAEELTEEDLLIYELTNVGNMRISEQIAEKFENQFRERAQRRSRGVKQAGFQVLYEASMPGVLIELGFISNPNEARYLTTDYGQSIVASAIFRSIRDFKEEYDRTNNRQASTD